jgi:hypothetical protein
VTSPTAEGHVRVFAEGSAPLASTLNFRAGQIRANNAVLPISSDGDVRVLTVLPSGSVHVILDAFGYFQ